MSRAEQGNPSAGWDASDVEALLEDMDGALCELVAPLGERAEGWTQGSAGKWSAGQHVEHVARIMGITADRLEEAASKLRAGTLRKRPWRDPLQAWWVRLVTRESFPRGAPSPADARPGPSPDRGLTLQRLAEVGARHRKLATELSAENRQKLWIWNPFVPIPWHYTLPEILRIHATHGRHHARLVREALRALPNP